MVILSSLHISTGSVSRFYTGSMRQEIIVVGCVKFNDRTVWFLCVGRLHYVKGSISTKGDSFSL